MFITESENYLSKRYLKDGYIIVDIQNIRSLDWIRNFYLKFIKNYFNQDYSNKDILNNFHKLIKINDLNNFRLSLIQEVNKDKNFRKEYYNVASPFLNEIVGNELVMQNRVNLSIQLPKDKSSLLDVHADTWSGDSPFESVVWLPLVNCFKTKSMFILPASKYKKITNLLQSSKFKNSSELFPKIKNDIKWLKINYGQVLIFNQCLPHGNLVNEEKETRWSMNCRFKGIFTPYGDKKLGEFFEPISLKAASKFAMKYKLPKIK
ncbi:2OG-Fe(II) oxygenase [Pelagibacterales bacterium SAG-MED25]|uniref:sporadic carbohydrate cluster 2OG-Fe(II) oxygenase n=1 Tax=Pelagibacter sp. (strain HTCC7211) TaxID=439493 RepID=UPI000552F6C7|nr:2OG-Fe(II) oxygenase [Pelagibacterales bacterium SAG-MED25]